MGDRVPIGTIVGLTNNNTGIDILIGTFATAQTVSTVFVRHSDYDDGGASNTAIAGSIRNATGGGGSGIAFTIANQTQSGIATGSLSVAAAGSLYLRLTTGSLSMNLTGWIETDASAVGTITTALTNLARVKQFLGISGSGDDDLLTNLINAVSGEVQGAIGRQIIQATQTSERVDSIGHQTLSLRYVPIISVASLTENGTTLVENTDFELTAKDKAAGLLVRLVSGDVAPWMRGTGVVRVTYDHGYATVPDAVVQTATELVAFDYLQSQPGGKRIGLGGTILPSGGESSYTTRVDLWKAQKPRLRAYTSVWL